MTHAHSRSDAFLDRMFPWRGQRDLVVVFWIYGVALSLILAALLVGALQAGDATLQQALIVLSALYTLWILTAIWRCAADAEPFWGAVARWLTVAWALNAALVLAFLQVDLSGG